MFQVSITYPLKRVLSDLVERIQKEIDENSIFEMVVRRLHILGDVLCQMEKITFDPRKKLHVQLCVYTFTHW